MTEDEALELFVQQASGKAGSQYSQGRLGPDDEGDLAAVMEVDRERKYLKIIFPKSISWLGLSVEDAIQLRDLLTARIDELQST